MLQKELIFETRTAIGIYIIYHGKSATHIVNTTTNYAHGKLAE